MIKFLIGFNAASGLSREQSLRHYRDRHGPLVGSIAEFRRHVGGYVQNFALDGDGAPTSDMDGVSELWFDGWDTYDTAFAEPLYLEYIRPDEQRFADFASLLVVFADDVRIFGGDAAPSHKLLRFLRRSDAVSAGEFQGAWENEYAAAVASDPIVRRLATGYVQNRPLRRDDLAFAPSDGVDGVDEYGFGSAADLSAFLEAVREAGAPVNPIVGSVVQIATETHVVEPVASSSQKGRS